MMVTWLASGWYMDIGVYETHQGGVLASFIWVILDDQKKSLNRDAIRGCL